MDSITLPKIQQGTSSSTLIEISRYMPDLSQLSQMVHDTLPTLVIGYPRGVADLLVDICFHLYQTMTQTQLIRDPRTRSESPSNPWILQGNYLLDGYR